MTLEELFRTHRKFFIFKMKRYVHEWGLAEDLVQEAFVKALLCQSQYNAKKGSLKGWFTKILFSHLWSYMRDVKKSPKMCDIDLVSEQDLFSYGEYHNLYNYVTQVANPIHQKVLVGFFVFGYTYKELATMFNLTQSNIRKIVQRFREEVCE